MAERTLLLNSTYEPLKVISWQRAVTMVYLGKVEVVRSYEYLLRAVSWRVQTPAVVRLHSFVKRHTVRIAFSRKNVFLRDGNRCVYCGDGGELTLDHVVPRSQGGATSWDNVVTCCAPCNRRKGNRTPEQASLRLRRRPVRPRTLPAVAVRVGGDSAHALWLDFLANAIPLEAAG